MKHDAVLRPKSKCVLARKIGLPALEQCIYYAQLSQKRI